MAKVTFVKRARSSKKSRKCVRCGKEIEVGESYRHAKFKTSPYSSLMRIWCKDHPPRSSELTVNDRLATLYAGQEALHDAAGQFEADEITVDELKSSVESVISDAEEVRDEYEESYNNLPDSLQQGSSGEGIEEKRQAVDEWIGVLNSLDLDFDPPLEDADELEIQEADDRRGEIAVSVQNAADELAL